MKRITWFLAVVVFGSLISCNPKSTVDTSTIAIDSASIAHGQNLFGQTCSACHNFRQDGIGPRLAGVTSEISSEHIKAFIRGPKTVIESGDERAKKLLSRFKTTMPSFDVYSEADLNALVAYLHTQKGVEKTEHVNHGELSDPIPTSISLSDLVVGLELVGQIPASSDKPPFTRITKLDYLPGTERIFVLDLRGKIYEMVNKLPVEYFNIATVRSHFIHQPGLATGLGSFAFHPDFIKNGLLYTTHTEAPKSAKADFSYNDSIPVTLQWVLTEWKTRDPKAASFKGEGRELLRINMVTGIHGVQDLEFNPYAKKGDSDYGMLFVGVGDGGCIEEHHLLVTSGPEHIWGTVLRIDPSGRNSDNGKYGIPADNPFAGRVKGTALREVFATGFRNPHRISWSADGRPIVVNIGQRNIEAMYLLQGGHFYGWPIREGSFAIRQPDINVVFPLPPDDSIYQVTYPVAEFDHDEGVAISGGFEYTGSALPQLKGKYLFGDIASGRLFYVSMADVHQGAQAPIKEWGVSVRGQRTTLTELCKNNRVDMRFGRDANGELYFVMKPDGKVYKFVTAEKW